jgi:hypothetical protein
MQVPYVYTGFLAGKCRGTSLFLVLRNNQEGISVMQVNVDLQITLRRQKLIRIIQGYLK